MKHIMTVLLALLAAAVMAAPNSKKTALPPDLPKKFSGQEEMWIKTALSEEYLKERASAICDHFLKDKNYPLPQLRFDIQELKSFEAYYFLESDSGISRRWVRQNIAYAESLLKARTQLNFFALNQKTASDEYRKWYDYYAKIAKEYWAVGKKPVKVQDKKLVNRLNKVKLIVAEQLKAREAAAKAQQPKIDDKKKRR